MDSRSLLNIFTGLELVITYVGYEANKQRNKIVARYAKQASFTLSVVASILLPPHGADSFINGMSHMPHHFRVDGDEADTSFAQQIFNVLHSHRAFLFSFISSVILPASVSYGGIEVGRLNAPAPPPAKERDKLTAISLEKFKTHPSDEIFFHREEKVHKIGPDTSQVEGDLILSNHRVIFDSKDLHEYKLSDLKKVEDKDDDLILRFAGNDRAHFKASKATRDTFDRIRKGDY